jgi:hypothetical protein
MSIKVNANLKARAEEASRKASEAVMRELDNAFDKSFTAKAWEWPGTTQRRVGTVGSPRNIIDIGTLRQSGSWEMTGAYSARFTWSANYATAVHEGYRRFRADGGASTWPARPWTSAVLGTVQVPGIKPFPIKQRMKDVWLAYFKASGR